MVDTFGRVANDLRISVTDRCNFRCTYCMPAEGLPWLPKAEILTFEEIAACSASSSASACDGDQAHGRRADRAARLRPSWCGCSAAVGPASSSR